MQRVLVLGGPGSGKTTFAVRLARALEPPVVHLDAHFWQAGWRESPRPEWAARVAALAVADRWVMDGHYVGTLALRARRADAILVLAPPRLTRVVRLVRRGLRDRRRARPDLAPGCAEQVPSWRFLREARTFGAVALLAVERAECVSAPDRSGECIEIGRRRVASVQDGMRGRRQVASDRAFVFTTTCRVHADPSAPSRPSAAQRGSVSDRRRHTGRGAAAREITVP